MFKWESGRLDSGYEKLKIFESKLFKCDLYLIKYKEGSSIRYHVDTVDKWHSHHRVNFVIKKAAIGGDFWVNNKNNYKKITSRFIHFRPDKYPHKVTEIISGTRWVLSFGYLKSIINK